MNELCRLIWCGLIGFFRSRTSLEAEILVLRHQLNVLRRKSPKRPTFGNIDRLIFAGLYSLAPNVRSTLAIVRPGHHYRPDDRSQVYGEEQEIAVARLEDVSAQPRRRDCLAGLVCDPNNLVSAPVWAADSETWPPRNPVSCGDRASQRG